MVRGEKWRLAVLYLLFSGFGQHVHEFLLFRACFACKTEFFQLCFLRFISKLTFGRNTSRGLKSWEMKAACMDFEHKEQRTFCASRRWNWVLTFFHQEMLGNTDRLRWWGIPAAWQSYSWVPHYRLQSWSLSCRESTRKERYRSKRNEHQKTYGKAWLWSFSPVFFPCPRADLSKLVWLPIHVLVRLPWTNRRITNPFVPTERFLFDGPSDFTNCKAYRDGDCDCDCDCDCDWNCWRNIRTSLLVIVLR